MTEAVISLSKGFAVKALKSVKIEKLNIIMILSIISLIVFYFFVSNNVVMVNYRRILLKRNIEDLKIEIRTLNLELTQKRSIGFIKKAAQDLNLVVNDVIQYIKVIGPVASREVKIR